MVAPTIPRERSREAAERQEQLAVAAPGGTADPSRPAAVTVACRNYRGHQLEHFRDVATGRFVCPVCEPAAGEPRQ